MSDDCDIVFQEDDEPCIVIVPPVEPVIVVSPQDGAGPQGPQGPQGPPGEGGGAIAVPFTYQTASPLALQAIAAGKYITRSVLVITTPFTDPSSTLQVGTTTTPGLVQGPADSKPSVADQYDSDSIAVNPVNDVLILSISPGTSTAGAGTLYYWPE